MSFGQGIQFTGVSSASPAASTLTGANNGLSPSSGNIHIVVLGQDVGQAGDPAALLSAREIPQAGFGLNIFGGGIMFSQARTAAPATGFNVRVTAIGAANLFNVGAGAHDFFHVQANGLIDIDDIKSGVSCINMLGQRYNNQPLPSSANSSTSWNNLWHPDATVDPAFLEDIQMGSRVVLDNAAAVLYTALLLDPQYIQTVASVNGQIVGIRYSPGYPSGPLSQQHLAMDIQTGDILLNSDISQALGRVGIQGVPTPTAFLEIGGSPAGAPGTASLKLDFGTALAAPEFGALEYIGTGLLFTPGATQLNILMGNDGAAAPALHATPVFTSYYGGNTDALGNPNNWVAVNINGTVYKIPLYT
jgi:hypothetical protein